VSTVFTLTGACGSDSLACIGTTLYLWSFGQCEFFVVEYCLVNCFLVHHICRCIFGLFQFGQNI